jgi:hypothetical protein
VSTILPNLILLLIIGGFIWYMLRRTQSGSNQETRLELATSPPKGDPLPTEVLPLDHAQRLGRLGVNEIYVPQGNSRGR